MSTIYTNFWQVCWNSISPAAVLLLELERLYESFWTGGKYSGRKRIHRFGEILTWNAKLLPKSWPQSSASFPSGPITLELKALRVITLELTALRVITLELQALRVIALELKALRVITLKLKTLRVTWGSQ